MKRYIYRDVPLTLERAQEIRDKEIADARCEIERRAEQIAERVRFISRKQADPLPTTFREQITLNPGDPGYDEAPTPFDPTNYQGDTTWLNLPTTPES